jgi:DNA-binding beta-propeller fold protein YncE
MKYFRSAWLAVALSLPAFPVSAAPFYRLVDTIPLGGGVKWDYLTVDAKQHRLYVSHGTEVTVVDLRRREVIGRLAGLPGSHGIAVDPATGDIWADSAGTSRAIAFSPGGFAPLAAVHVVEDADGMAYDPASKSIFVSGGDGQALTSINPATRAAYADIPLGGAPEGFLADGKGALYVNIVDKNELVRIDTKQRVITARWPTPGCIEPTGLAMDDAKRLLFISCRGGSMVALNADSGAVLATIPIGQGTDAAGFDAVRHRAFSTNGDGTLTVIDDSTVPRQLGTVRTAPGARTMALDPETGDVLTVTATVTGIVPSATPGGRIHYIFAPGSLKLLIYAPVP